MHVVLIETSGNQNYIFATNKLRENVGASELTFRAGTDYVIDAVLQAGGPDLGKDFPNSLLDPVRNPPLSGSNYPVEVVLAVSGKAILLVRDRGTGQKIVRAVTLRALREAPGLDVRGVVGPADDAGAISLHDAIKKAHQLLEQVRSGHPGPAARFQRLPVVAECATSGLPAACHDRSHSATAEHGPRSHQLIAKQQARAADGAATRRRQQH